MTPKLGVSYMEKKAHAYKEGFRDMLMNYNLYPNKIMAGVFAGFVSMIVDNLLPLFFAVCFFELVDFITGCWKSAVVSHRKGERFHFESVKAWRSLFKFVILVVGMVELENIDLILAEDTRLRLANYFVGAAGGVEFWSLLENGAVISDKPFFVWLRQFMKVKAEDKLGTSIDSLKNGIESGNNKEVAQE